MTSATTITVRESQQADVDFLVAMNRIVHDLHVAAAPAYYSHADPAAVADLFRSRLQRQDGRVWIASVGDAPAGYAVTVVRERPGNAIFSALQHWEIEELGVSRAHRKKGVARALIERVLADARERGVRDVQLTCWSFNAEAQAAFEALGFRPMTVRFQRGIE